MKTTRFLMLVILVATIGLLMPVSALARTRVSIGVGIGFPVGYYGHYGPYWHHGYWGGPWYPYYYGPDVVYVDPYYPPPVIVAPPYVAPAPVIVPPPMAAPAPVVVRPPLPPQSIPAPVNNAGVEKIRLRKSQLLSQLKEGTKEQKLYAVGELGGYSWDDEVKAALENVLLSDPDPQMRSQAADSFGKVKNPNALSVLEKVRVEDSDIGVRQAADSAIKQINS